MGKAAPNQGRLEIVGGSRPRKRKASGRRWTAAREREFFTTLGETCNVTAAAQACGMSLSSAYARRKSVAAFRAGWAEAIGAAYQRLELVLLDRALNGVEKVVKRRDGSEEVMRDYSNQMALTLLKMHRESAADVLNEPSEEETAEARARLLEKLKRLRKRIDAEEGAK